jgi:hypothetical protein
LLPALEEGSDHFARTSGLLDLVCDAVGRDAFYACLWDVLATHSSVSNLKFLSQIKEKPKFITNC